VTEYSLKCRCGKLSSNWFWMAC